MGCGGGGGPTGGLRPARSRAASGTPVNVYTFDPVENARRMRASGLICGICVPAGFALVGFALESAWFLLAIVLLFVGLIAGVVCGGSIVEHRSRQKAVAAGNAS